MDEKMKLKKGDYVQVQFPVAAQIKRISNAGYTLTILPTPVCEACYYIDKDVIKISKKRLDRYATPEYLKNLKEDIRKIKKRKKTRL
jgi:hypothetical protein